MATFKLASDYKNKIFRAAEGKRLYSIEGRIKRNLKKARSQLIKDFDNHPVTIELEERADSSYLIGDRNSLFGFIGFPEDEEPAEIIRNYLSSENLFTVSPLIFRRKTAKAQVSIPDTKYIFNITPMPWAAGRSWAKGIESGISGLGRFLGKEGYGRSDMGIQVPHNLNSSTFKPTKYISYIVRKAVESIRSEI